MKIGVLERFADSGRNIGVRHLQGMFMFLNITIAYFIRISASIAVVAMTNKNTTNPDFEEFPWTIPEQSLILSSFSWGYVVTQLPAGWFAQRYGAKGIFICSTLSSSILGILVPISVHHGGYQAYCAIRVLQGLAQGFIFPSLHSFIAKWAPFRERNLLGAFSHSGMEVGTILAFTASGYIAGSSLGWPGIYYISGGLGVLWVLFWAIFGASNPYVCKYISPEEIKYIESSLETNEETQTRKLPIPWKDIWLSVPFLTLLITRIGQAWGYSTLMNEIPKYMTGVLDMNIRENALFSGLPYMLMLLVGYTSIILAYILMKKNIISLKIVRKTFNTMAFWIPALALFGLTFVTKDQKALAIALFVIAVGLNGMNTIGSVLTHIDLSPNHVGILVGISNTIGNSITLITPLVFSAIVDDMSNLSQWKYVFYIAAGFFFVTNFIYIIFGQTDTQPWNEPKTSKDIEKSTLTSKNKGIGANAKEES